jgi:hypothetical protein
MLWNKVWVYFWHFLCIYSDFLWFCGRQRIVNNIQDGEGCSMTFWLIIGINWSIIFWFCRLAQTTCDNWTTVSSCTSEQGGGSELGEEIDKQNTIIQTLQDKLDKVEERVEEHEHYSRRTSLRFKNVRVPTNRFLWVSSYYWRPLLVVCRWGTWQ